MNIAVTVTNSDIVTLGYPGYDASRDYIKSKLEKYSDTAISWIQDFPALFVKVESITFSIGALKYSVLGPTYSPSTSAEGVTAPFALGILGDAGCNAVSKSAAATSKKGMAHVAICLRLDDLVACCSHPLHLPTFCDDQQASPVPRKILTDTDVGIL